MRACVSLHDERMHLRLQDKIGYPGPEENDEYSGVVVSDGLYLENIINVLLLFFIHIVVLLL